MDTRTKKTTTTPERNEKITDVNPTYRKKFSHSLLAQLDSSLSIALSLSFSHTFYMVSAKCSRVYVRCPSVYSPSCTDTLDVAKRTGTRGHAQHTNTHAHNTRKPRRRHPHRTERARQRHKTDDHTHTQRQQHAATRKQKTHNTKRSKSTSARRTRPRKTRREWARSLGSGTPRFACVCAFFAVDFLRESQMSCNAHAHACLRTFERPPSSSSSRRRRHAHTNRTPHGHDVDCVLLCCACCYRRALLCASLGAVCVCAERERSALRTKSELRAEVRAVCDRVENMRPARLREREGANVARARISSTSKDLCDLCLCVAVCVRKCGEGFFLGVGCERGLCGISGENRLSRGIPKARPDTHKHTLGENTKKNKKTTSLPPGSTSHTEDERTDRSDPSFLFTWRRRGHIAGPGREMKKGRKKNALHKNRLRYVCHPVDHTK